MPDDDKTNDETLASLQVPTSTWNTLSDDVQDRLRNAAPRQRTVNRALARAKSRRRLSARAEAVIQEASAAGASDLAPLSSTKEKD